MPTATASSTTRAAPRPGSPTRAGRTARIRSSTPTAATPTGPIALVEVQGYVYAAFRAHGRARRPARRAAEAAPLERQGRARCGRAVEERFWIEELGTYAIALDGARPAVPGAHAPTRATCCSPACPHRTRPSAWPRSCSRRRLQHRLGHAHAGAAASRATTRCPTTTARSGRTTPPCAPLGMARYGERDGAVGAAERHVRDRGPASTCACRSCSAASRARPGEPPIAYPVACLPQAWAAGSVFMMLQACLGLTDRRLARRDPRRPSAAADRHRPADHPAARGGRGQGRPDVPAHRRAGGGLSGEPRGRDGPDHRACLMASNPHRGPSSQATDREGQAAVRMFIVVARAAQDRPGQP